MSNLTTPDGRFKPGDLVYIWYGDINNLKYYAGLAEIIKLEDKGNRVIPKFIEFNYNNPFNFPPESWEEGGNIRFFYRACSPYQPPTQGVLR